MVVGEGSLRRSYSAQAGVVQTVAGPVMNTAAPSVTSRPTTMWRKILYEDQGVPDNYVDESFLEEMKKNLYTRTYEFWPVVRESGVVTQQVSSLVLFVVVFVYMSAGIVSPQLVFGTSAALTLLGYVLYSFLERLESSKSRTVWDDLQSAVVFMSFGFGLSPILMTLTDTISTDTIYAMTTAMAIANLLFHDYGAEAAMVSQSLSLNAAIFASVCLASRLPTAWHAFTTVTLAVEVFGLWPVLRRKLKKQIPSSHVWLTVLLGGGATVSLASVSTVAAVIFTLAHLFISFICPAWLIGLQPYKNNIYGPWDEAVIQE